MASFLPHSIAARVERLCAEGDAFLAQRNYNAAILRYATAFRVLPRPAERWSCTPGILAAMTNACFAKADFPSARLAALAALECPEAGDSAAMRCKLGQILYEEGEFLAAREQLTFALSRGGESVFADEDPKYRELATPGAG